MITKSNRFLRFIFRFLFNYFEYVLKEIPMLDVLYSFFADKISTQFLPLKWHICDFNTNINI